MPLQNRVTPFGEIIADPARGQFMGNRGGRIHDPDTRRLTNRRWASRRWICCVTAFKGRQRAVMGRGYTELFFLDEVTALAAGHRPCFECRRGDAIAFSKGWAEAQGHATPLKADTMDVVLHGERRLALTSPGRTLNADAIAQLPDGAMIALPPPADGAEMTACALRGGHILPWSPSGYGAARPIGRQSNAILLTPASICAVLTVGYTPRWHDSAHAE